jgi:hypothetical protein
LVVGFTKNITYFDGIKRTLFMYFVWELDIMSCFVRYLYKSGENVRGEGGRVVIADEARAGALRDAVDMKAGGRVVQSRSVYHFIFYILGIYLMQV